MDQYEFYEKQINEGVKRYRKNRQKDVYRKLNHELDMYQLFLEENSASKEKYQWLTSQRRLLNDLKMQKQLINTKQIKKDEAANLLNPQDQQNLNLGLEFVQKLNDQINEDILRVQKGVQKAIEVSSFIKIELDRQIKLLDDVYVENKNMESRLNRVKQGLIVILRRAMTNKITRCLAILLILAIIGLIVMYVLKNNGVIL